MLHQSFRGSLAKKAAPPCQAHKYLLRATSRAARSLSSESGVLYADESSADDADDDSYEDEAAAMRELRPVEVMDKLNEFIVGQEQAKKAVAVALRNRWRRRHLPEELKLEVIPRNILMIGPTGCGKTEIARRVAKLCEAPFLKVEATKFTEVGFHGTDVEQIVKDLVEVSMTITRKRKMAQLRPAANSSMTEKILDTLTGDRSSEGCRNTFREMLRKGELNDREIYLDLPERGSGPPPMMPLIGGELDNVMGVMQKMLKPQRDRKMEKRKLTVREAKPILRQLAMDNLLDKTDIRPEALQAAQETGIVFIDELDKICSNKGHRGSADASAEGVQRDLLPLIEGCTINTKYGDVNTDYMLFIGSGAFHQCKPSDLLAELQGRLPIRVELQALSEEDMYRILTEPKCNLLRQQKALLKTEGVELEFTDEAVREVARIATSVNRSVENIGARRLHTIMERIMEEISFTASDMEPGSKIVVNKDLCIEKVSDLLVKSDLSRYIL